MADRDVTINLVGRDLTGKATRSAANNLDQLARKIEKFNGGGTADIKAKSSVDNRAVASTKKAFATAGDQAGKSFVSRLQSRIRRGLNAADKFLVPEKIRRAYGVAGDRSGDSFITRFYRRMKTLPRTGARAGAGFAAGFIKTLTFGQIGSGFAKSMIRLAPIASKAGATVGAAFAGVLILEITQALSAAASLFIGGGLLAGPIIFLLAQQHKASKETQAQIKRVQALRKRVENAATKDSRERLQKQLAGEQRVLDDLRKQSQQWDNIKARAKSFMEFISAPLRIPLEKSINAMFRGFNQLKGPVREVMAQLGSALPGLTEGAFNALSSFIAALKPAIPNVVAGLREWGRVMPQITASVGTLLARLTAHPEAIQGFADSFDTFTNSVGDVITGFQGVAQSYGQLEALIRGGRTGQWGEEWTKTSGKVGVAAKAISRSQLWILQHYDDFLQHIKAIPGSPFAKLQADTHQARLQMEAEFAAMTAAKTNFDHKLESTGSKIAGYKAAISTLKSLKKATQAALADPHLSKAKRIKLELDLSHYNAQMATAKAKLHLLQNTKSKPKLQADKSALEKVVKQANADLKKTHNKKTKPKIQADKAQAEAAIAEVNARLKALDGDSATVHINTVVTYAKSPSGRRVRVKDPGLASGGASWAAALSGGSGYRTEPPTVNVAAPNVDTRVYLDGGLIASVAKSTIRSENSRQGYRARVGRRR